MTKPVHILKNKIAYIFPFCDSSLTPGIAKNGELRIKQHSKCSRGRGWLAEIIDGETLLIINTYTYITCFLWSNEPIVGWINISDTNGKHRPFSLHGLALEMIETHESETALLHLHHTMRVTRDKGRNVQSSFHFDDLVFIILKAKIIIKINRPGLVR